MKLLGVNTDLLRYRKETYGVKHRQSELSINALNGFLDGMRINNQPPELITERIGWYDHQDFAQVAFINELNLWANMYSSGLLGILLSERFLLIRM